MELYRMAASDPEQPPWSGGSSITVEGSIYQTDTRHDRKSIYLKNISIISEPDHPESETASYTDSRILVYLQQNEELVPGMRVRLTGTCTYPEEAYDPGGFEGREYYHAQNIRIILKKARLCEIYETRLTPGYLIETVRNTLRASIRRTAEEKEQGVIEAILLGDKNDLDDEIRALYQDNGLMHMLAVSGLHISFIGMSIYRVLRKCRCSFLCSALAGGTVLFLFVLLAGIPVSGIRAMIMFFLYLGSQILGRTYDLPISMTVSAAFILIGNPARLLQSGFLLSFLAVAGVYMSQCWQSRFLKKNALGVSIGTWLATLPVTAWYYYKVPIYGILLNLLFIPTLSLVMLSGMAGMIAGLFSAGAGTFFMAGAHYILKFTFFLCSLVRRVPGSVLITGRPHILQAVLFYGLLIFIMYFFRLTEAQKRKECVIRLAVILSAVFLLLFKIPQPWSVTFLNVGQGDAVCIRTEDRAAWMIDGGSSTVTGCGTKILEPYLAYMGISRAEGWMISHYDNDHAGGLVELLENYERDLAGRNIGGITIGEIILPDTEEESKIRDRILTLAAANEIPVRFAAKGDHMENGDMKLTVLSPDRSIRYEDNNESSMAVLAEYHGFRILLTGDICGQAERELAEMLKNFPAGIDILKVAHHGSENSSSDEFLEASGGKLAVISCGKENRYGHPHESLLKRLKEHGYGIYRIDEEGLLTVNVK